MAPTEPAVRERAALALRAVEDAWAAGQEDQWAPAAVAALRAFLERGCPPADTEASPPGSARLCWGEAGWLALPRAAAPGKDSAPPLLVPRHPQAELQARWAAWAREWFLPLTALTAPPGLAADELGARSAELACALSLGRLALAPLVAAAEARRAAWLKPRLVLESQLCLPLGDVPAALQGAVSAAPAVQTAWEAEGFAPGETDPATLARRPVDTSWLPAPLRRALREALGARLDDVRGLFLVSENAGALRWLAPRLAGQVRLSYLDPPFNTASDKRAYRDAFPTGTWLSFMDERLAALVPLLTADGTVYAHIDGYEKERLRLLLDRHLHHVGEIVWRIGWCSGFKTRARKFLRNHDTIYHYGRSERPLFVKSYLPYPEGYRRRDGQPPRGAGYPLEDTWNCSPLDRLDSIQIVSFSREKVGNGLLTQKPEALLLRMIEASSLPDDWVLDPFAGSGTTCAAAHKSGRRWVGIEWAEAPLAAALPRLRRVVGGDRYGISTRTGWKGGGAFAWLRLERLEDSLAGLDADPAHGLAWSLEGERVRLRWEGVPDPLACRLATPEGPGPQVDLAESLAWLLGLTGRSERQLARVRATLGRDPADEAVVILWPEPGASDEQLRAAAEACCAGARGRLLVWGLARARAFEGWRAGWSAAAVQAALEDCMQPH